MSASLDLEDLTGRIVDRARGCAIELDARRARALAEHARRVLQEAGRLHLTTVTEPSALLERHLGESFEGAALLEADVAGPLLDLGSGNGYPGLPVAAARPGLRPVLVEASSRKAAFLRSVVEAEFREARVLERQVQRPSDLADEAAFAVLTARAVGGWERVLPRLAGCLEPGGQLLVWAGGAMDRVRARAVWRRFELAERRALPFRERSWVWRFVRRGTSREFKNINFGNI